MNIKKFSSVAAGLALAFAASSAGAVTLTAGDLKITINNFDSGTVNYGNSAGVKCTTEAQCDAVPGIIPSISAYGEDSWGIFSVATITSVSDGHTVYSVGQGGRYLTGIFGGLQDFYAEVSGTLVKSTTTASHGGWLKMFETGVDYNSSLGPGGRIGQYGYTGITDVPGTMVLDAVFGAGVLADDPSATYTTSFANKTIAGGGQGYLDVVGGTWQTQLDTNAQFDANGNAHDLLLDTTFHATPQANAVGWTVVSASQVEGQALPEPASIALFGLGLAGIAGLRRRASK